jgi:hypothetical protein
MKDDDVLIRGCEMLIDIIGDWDAAEIRRNTGCGTEKSERDYSLKIAVADLLKRKHS